MTFRTPWLPNASNGAENYHCCLKLQFREATSKKPLKDCNYNCLKVIFSAVAYLRGKLVTKGNQTPKRAFVFSKATVVPMKYLTIPKLELQAALIPYRLRQEKQRAVSLNIEKIFLWTNSETVLQWLHSLEKRPIFVANRVAELLELTTDDEWNHVPTGDNRADAATRGLSATALFESSWLEGPDVANCTNWPFIPCCDVITKMISRKFAPRTELMKNETHEMTTLTAHVTIKASTFEWQKYSSYEKRLRIVAYIYIICRNSVVIESIVGL